ncbi:MAG: hypothetical protein ACK2U3_05130 [Anaerolineales bacterium]|jgi:uncharacterized membrane protein
MNTPDWGLTLTYFLHMVATVVSVGGIFIMFFSLASLASLRKPDIETINLQLKIVHRLEAAGWFCAAVLVGTGLLQMSANPNYIGFLEIDNRWSSAILIKHLFFLLIALVSVYISLVLLPRVRRSFLQASHLSPGPALEKLLDNLSAEFNRVTIFIAVNFIFAIIILSLTAVARIS